MNYKNKIFRSLLFTLTFAGLAACNVENSNNQQSLVTQSTIVAEHPLFAKTTAQQDFKDVAYGNGVYVTVGSSGAIYTSTNMKHWFEQSGVTTKNINGVVFNPVRKRFYAVGDDGVMLSSADGVSWTLYQSLSPSVRLNTINVLADGNEVIGGDSGNIFEVVLGKDGDASDKIINRKFYNQSSLDSSSAVNAVVAGGVYMVAANATGVSDTKLNSDLETEEWKYHGNIDGAIVSDVTYSGASNYFHAVLKNGHVSNLSAKKQTAKWTEPVCVAHKSDDVCLTDSTANSIDTDQSSEHVVVVGGGSDDRHTFIANSEDSNSWDILYPENTYKLNKVRCFGDSKASRCLAVGDKKTLGIIEISGNKLKWTKVNITAPEVTSFTPSDNATRVDLTPIFELGFNDPVTNVNDNTVEIHEASIDGKKIPLANNITPSDSHDHYSFSLAEDVKFKELAKYFVIIKSGIVDKYGMPIREKIFSFTTGDFTAPEMVVVNPETDATGISLTPNIEVKFSKHVNNISGSVTLREDDEAGHYVPISDFTPMEGNAYTFTAKDNLKSLTRYCVVATSGVIDDYDNRLIPTSSCFTTGDYIVPTVTMTTPANNATDVNLYTDISLKFSRAVQNVTDKTVTIHAGSVSGPAVNIKDLSGSGDSYLIKLSRGTLLQDKKYFVVLDSAIVDMTTHGNHLVPYVFNFETSKQAIVVDPLAPTAANGKFILNMRVSISENLKVDLPSFFTAKDGITTVACEAGKVCQLEVSVSDMNGYTLPMNVAMPIKGLDTEVEATASITISDRPTMVVFSSRSDKGVEICKVEKSGLTNCKMSKNVVAGDVFGAKISSSGKYIYLLTGKQSATETGDGVYKCDIDKVTFAVTSCIKQDKTSNYNTRTLLLSPDGNYAYFNNMYSPKTIDRCNVSPADGSLVDCKSVTKSNFDVKIERMVMSDSGRNLYVNVDTGVQICSLYENNDEDLRSTISCKSAGTGVPTAKWGMTMGDDNSVMYFLGGRASNEVMWSCARDKNNYTLSNCKAGSTAISGLSLQGVTGLAVAEQYVLITDYQKGAYQCQFSSDKRSLTSCTSIKAVTMKDLEAVDIFQ